MSRRSRVARPVILAGTAMAGLVGSHLLDYTLLIPDHAARQTFLHQTGHGYFRNLMVLALAAGVLALITSMVTGYRRGRSNVGGAPRFSDWGWKLGPIQAIGFVVLEFAERFAAHSALHHYADLTISIGILIQVIAACVGAALLVLLDRAAEQVGRARSHPVSRTRPTQTWPRPATVVLVLPRFARSGLVRAPPSAAA
jgi:hypothetical protein